MTSSRSSSLLVIDLFDTIKRDCGPQVSISDSQLSSFQTSFGYYMANDVIIVFESVSQRFSKYCQWYNHEIKKPKILKILSASNHCQKKIKLKIKLPKKILPEFSTKFYEKSERTAAVGYCS